MVKYGEQKITEKKPDNTIENSFRKIWDSNLFVQFDKGELPEEISKFSISGSLDLRYSSDNYKNDIKEKIKTFQNHVKSFENSGITHEKFSQTKEFFNWLTKEIKK